MNLPLPRCRQLVLNFFCLTFALSSAAVIAQQRPLIAVVNEQDTQPYAKTVESFESALRELASVEIFRVSAAADWHRLEAQRPDLIFALGASAVRKSQESFRDSPLLATMILSSSVLDEKSQATAVLLEASVFKQLEWHRRILPNARRVGVLYSPDQSTAWVEEAEAAARRLDLQIVAVPVNTPQDLPAALKSLGRRADSILGIPDTTVYSSKTAKAVLLFSFRNRIPFVGMSGVWVKAGALYGLDWDYAELGRQCAEMASDIIGGAQAQTIRPKAQDALLYQLNLRAAKQLRIELSPELIAGASEVFQ